MFYWSGFVRRVFQVYMEAARIGPNNPVFPSDLVIRDPHYIKDEVDIHDHDLFMVADEVFIPQSTSHTASILHIICWSGELQEAAGWAGGRGVPGLGPGAKRSPQPADREPARGQARGPQGHQVTYGHKPANCSDET